MEINATYLSHLPPRVQREIEGVCALRGGGCGISELHLCIGTRSSLKYKGERIKLSSLVTQAEMEKLFSALCGNAVYAHRDTILDGYISISGGVRVGICGQARYEGARLVGVSNISSLLFRIPSAPSSLADQLYCAFLSAERGMLIYAAPGGGKTTALRSLVPLLVERLGLRVSVIDEREEFYSAELFGVDVFRGYKRYEGVEIALRTMSPDIIVIDELGGALEAERLTDWMNSGVRMIATAHATSVPALMKRRSFAPFSAAEIFDVFVGIFNTDGTFRAEITRAETERQGVNK